VELKLKKSKIIIVNIGVSLMLTACAVPNVNRTATSFSEADYSATLNLCQGRNFVEGSLKTIGAGLLGSLGGAAIVGVHGAVAAGGPEAIAVGAAIGAVIGLGIGVKDAVDEYDQEITDCLRDKGYEFIAATN
jgi:outer membrane lipoprotein SlyB